MMREREVGERWERGGREVSRGGERGKGERWVIDRREELIRIMKWFYLNRVVMLSSKQQSLLGL